MGWNPLEAVGSIVGGIVDVGTSLIGMDKQKDTAKDLQNWQNDYNSQMYYENREYNDPANQMARLQNAGINPHLAYANGAQGLTAVSPSSGSSSAGSMPKLTNLQNTLGNSLVHGLFTEKELQNLQEDINTKVVNQEVGRSQASANYANESLMLANIQNIIAKTYSQNLDNEIKEYSKQNLIDISKYQSELLQKQIQETHHSTLLKESQRYLNILEQSLKDTQLIKLSQEIKNIQTQGLLLREDIALKKYQNALAKVNLNPQDPLYSRMVSALTDDPELAQEIILGLEGLGSTAKLISNTGITPAKKVNITHSTKKVNKSISSYQKH